jgi:hypothetical protein
VPSDDSWNSPSHASLTIEGSRCLTLWSPPGSVSESASPASLQLQIHPDRPVIVGRQQGGETPYLDPLYQPTPMLPKSGRTILRRSGKGEDRYVSRGHFMLRSHSCGVVLVNGVPKRGGGIRSPLNGTWLLTPVRRALQDEEEYLIERGATVRIWLPNEVTVQILAG